ncbi:hypothetical protein Rs2_20681 [Raphanus sativus]|nr:hypothetical protein Rs2_20681 [Raphanus sativus]
MSAKDPLEALYKEREELTKFVLAIGGLITVASFSSPPGGLDSDGYIRFRHTSCYGAYLVLNKLGFVASYFNLAQLHKQVKEQANKAETLRRRLTLGWMLLWLVIALFFGSFTAGFWLVYPDKEPRGSPWPRWFTLGLSVAKVVGGLVYVFGRKLVSYCF